MANKPVKIKCVGKDAVGKHLAIEGCDHMFEFKTAEIIQQEVDPKKGVIKYSITCPNCHTNYAVAYESKLMIERKKELQVLDTAGVVIAGKTQKRIDVLRQLIADEQLRLRVKYGH